MAHRERARSTLLGLYECLETVQDACEAERVRILGAVRALMMSARRAADARGSERGIDRHLVQAGVRERSELVLVRREAPWPEGWAVGGSVTSHVVVGYAATRPLVDL